MLGAGPPIPFGRLRYTVTAGVGTARIRPRRHRLVRADLRRDRGEQARPPESGAVVVVPWTRNERAATAGLKTTSYADNVVALA